MDEPTQSHAVCLRNRSKQLTLFTYFSVRLITMKSQPEPRDPNSNLTPWKGKVKCPIKCRWFSFWSNFVLMGRSRHLPILCFTHNKLFCLVWPTHGGLMKATTRILLFFVLFWLHQSFSLRSTSVMFSRRKRSEVATDEVRIRDKHSVSIGASFNYWKTVIGTRTDIVQDTDHLYSPEW